MGLIPFLSPISIVYQKFVMISPKLQILILTLVKASLTDDEDLEDEREASGDSDYDNGSGREPIPDTKQIRNRGSDSTESAEENDLTRMITFIAIGVAILLCISILIFLVCFRLKKSKKGLDGFNKGQRLS